MSSKKSFYVDGISCAGCVNAVEKTLQNVEGITDARVNLANGKTTVESSSGISDELIIEAVERAGYSVRENSLGSKKKA